MAAAIFSVAVEIRFGTLSSVNTLRILSRILFIQFVAPLSRGTVISAALLRSPASSDCAFARVGRSVSSLYTFPLGLGSASSAAYIVCCAALRGGVQHFRQPVPIPQQHAGLFRKLPRTLGEVAVGHDRADLTAIEHLACMDFLYGRIP